MVTLSKRLERIAGMVPHRSRLADIGSDHALLPVFLAEKGAVLKAVAGEVNDGPCAAARKQVEDAGLGDRIDVRKGDGLAVVAPGEVDTVTIAGMGGGLIVRILTEGISKLGSVNTLVLQPNVGEELARSFLLANDWFLAEETILEEDGKIYEILKAVRLPDAAERNAALYRRRTMHGLEVNTERLLAMGPYLLAAASPVFVRKWQLELAKRERILRELGNSGLEASAEKRIAVERDITGIKEVLPCLQKDKP